jgi:hypothetical protein
MYLSCFGLHSDCPFDIFIVEAFNTSEATVSYIHIPKLCDNLEPFILKYFN